MEIADRSKDNFRKIKRKCLEMNYLHSVENWSKIKIGLMESLQNT